MTGAIYKGNCEHTALKAGGTEDAQLTVASKGAVTTSEKYFVAHSAHTTIKFVSAAWKSLGAYPDNSRLATLPDESYTSGSQSNRPSTPLTYEGEEMDYTNDN